MGFSLPLWFFNKQKNHTKSAQALYESAKANEISLAHKLQQMIADMEIALRTFRESILQYDTSIYPQAQASFEAAQAAYEVGQVDFEALLSSRLELLEIELERLNILKMYNQKIAELYELLGVNIKEKS